MKLENKLKISVSQVTSFGRATLPKTTLLAETYKNIVERELDATTRTLPFDDRVLYWLAPELQRDIILFHGGKGMPLKAMFHSSAVAHLDAEYYQILLNRIRERAPGAKTIADQQTLKQIRSKKYKG